MILSLLVTYPDQQYQKHKTPPKLLGRVLRLRGFARRTDNYLICFLSPSG